MASQPDCAQLLSLYTGRQFLTGNSVEVLNNGQEIFASMLAAIDGAKSTIDFQTYVYWRGDIAIEFARHLADAAKRGVEVRVLLDGFGAKSIAEPALSLIKQHCRLCWFRPLRKIRVWQNLKRSHRKLLICDGNTGFTGGVGIAQEWLGQGGSPGWRDSHYRLTGPIVSTLSAAFLEGWIESCDPEEAFEHSLPQAIKTEAGDVRIIAVPSTASDFWSSAGVLLLSSIALAKKSLKIVTPYFVLDRDMKFQLLAASKRGVEIQIVIPAYRNSDSHLAGMAALNSIIQLSASHVSVYAYEPTMNHNKCVIVDEEVAIIGSVNFNQRSQRKDQEFSLIIQSDEIVSKLLKDFEQDLQSSTLLDEQVIRKRHRFLGYFAKMVYPIRRHI